MVYTLAIGLGQLIFGPPSDAIGRRRITLTGVGIHAVTTFILTQAASLYVFLNYSCYSRIKYCHYFSHLSQRSM